MRIKVKIMLNSLQKAFRINKNKAIYGSFAEIGAGQEVARFFFPCGKIFQYHR